jgi:two-component system cell cycle sensor histidine kinase/response regulator CckA
MSRRTILVVDDEPHIRSLVRWVLARDDHRVLEASDGVDAIEILGEPGATIDLLLTDIVMPRMDGVELARRVSTRLPSVRVLYMSGKCDVDAVHQDIRSKGYGFIRKPFDIAELSVKVGEFLAAPARKQAAGETGRRAGRKGAAY